MAKNKKVKCDEAYFPIEPIKTNEYWHLFLCDGCRETIKMPGYEVEPLVETPDEDEPDNRRDLDFPSRFCDTCQTQRRFIWLGMHPNEDAIEQMKDALDNLM